MLSSHTYIHPSTVLFALSVCTSAVQAQTVSGGEIRSLAPVEVSASRETADGPVIGYRATRSATATRTDTPIEDIPRSISVISAEVMEDIGEERIDRALDFAGGVTRGNNFGGIDMAGTNLRGFNTGSQYRNGMATAGNNRGFRATPDSANIERVEVLKGPASGLFGRGEPGGLINVVTKTPQPEKFTRGKISAARWDRYRGTLDVNTPLNNDASVLGRLNVAIEDNGSFRDYMSNQRLALYPSVRWQLTPTTSLLVNAEWLRNDNVFDRGIPAINGQFGQVPISNFYGEPSSDKLKNRNQLLQMVLEHELTADWKLRMAGQYARAHLSGGATETSAPLAATPEIIPRFYRERSFRSASFSSQIDLQGNFQVFGWQHQVLLGAEYERYRLDMRINTTGSAINAFGVNIWNPVYGQPRPAFNHGRRSDSLNRESSYAVNVQDQIYFTSRLIGNMGLRYDNLHPESDDRKTGVQSSYRRDAVVPRLGLLYKVTPQVSTFTSASTSFQANGIKSTGEVYEPEKGVGYEVGLKLNLFDDRLGATLGVFHITKKNVKTPHPDPLEVDSITVGEQRSQGFDMQVSGRVTQALRLIGAYAFVDAQVTKDNRANYTGNRLAGVPRHSASILAVYQLQGMGHNPNVTMQRAPELGASLNYIDARRASVTSRFELPGYHTVDVFTRWSLRAGMDVALNLNNMFNKQYYERGWSTWAGVPGDPRNLKLTVSFDL